MEDLKPNLLWGDNNEEDMKAIKLLKEAKIDFYDTGPIGDTKTPLLFWQGKEYHGLKAIELFINQYKKFEEDIYG